MTRFTKDSKGYHVSGKVFEALEGSRAQVWHGTAYKTSGGLTKSHLMQNKNGRIVSTRKHQTAKKEMRLVKAGYGTKKGKFGFVKLSSSSKSRKHRGGGNMPPPMAPVAPQLPIAPQLPGAPAPPPVKSPSPIKPTPIKPTPINSTPVRRYRGGKTMASRPAPVKSPSPVAPAPVKPISKTMVSKPIRGGNMVTPSESTMTPSSTFETPYPHSNMNVSAIGSETISKTGGRRHKRGRGTKGGMLALTPHSISGIESTSGADLQLMATNY